MVGGGGGPGMGAMPGSFARMSPLGGYPGQPGVGMGQYGGMRGPGSIRQPYHRPSSISPGAQVSGTAL